MVPVWASGIFALETPSTTGSVEKTLSCWGPPVPSQVSGEPLILWRAATSSGVSWEDLATLTVILGADILGTPLPLVGLE